jgi:selenide,water dikinase
MGGKPVLALNLVCFPEAADGELLKLILQGGAEKVLEAGAVIAGGHSIYDHEAKYGLAVTGLVNPNKFLRNDSAENGDVLLLTKALGVGLVFSAARENAAPQDAYAAAVDSACTLNRYAAEVMLRFPVTACTDVTGFGLLVHAKEMAGGADGAHTIEIDSAALPVIDGAGNLAAKGFGTAGAGRNRTAMKDVCKIDAAIPKEKIELLYDPQTSGGLLIAVPPKFAPQLLSELKAAGVKNAAIIGKVEQRRGDVAVVVQ